jgi:hypothetical protein
MLPYPKNSIHFSGAALVLEGAPQEGLALSPRERLTGCDGE